jgi:membrane-bound ClpP family serine protease
MSDPADRPLRSFSVPRFLVGVFIGVITSIVLTFAIHQTSVIADFGADLIILGLILFFADLILKAFIAGTLLVNSVGAVDFSVGVMASMLIANPCIFSSVLRLF